MKKLLFIMLCCVAYGCARQITTPTICTESSQKVVDIVSVQEPKTDAAVILTAKITSMTDKRCEWKIILNNRTGRPIIVGFVVTCEGLGENDKVLGMRSTDGTAKVEAYKTSTFTGISAFDVECAGFKVDEKLSWIHNTD